MTHRVLKPIAILLIMLFAIGLTCAGSVPQSTQTGGFVELSSEDAGRTVTVHPADQLEVVLDGNPTTGYQWEISSVDSAILKPIGEVEFRPDSNALGAGGKVALHFEALAPGTTILKLIYHRSFGQDVPPLRTFEVEIEVK